MDVCFHNNQQYPCTVQVAGFDPAWWMIALFALALIAAIVFLIMAFGPRYSVYSSRLRGQAALAEAEAESKVTVRNALADEEAAIHLAKAEIIRADGVAKAIEIIGHGLKENHSYLQYLWIEKLNEQDAHLIYVPTEAGLPILEAGRATKEHFR
jgi:hypothetical protein